MVVSGRLEQGGARYRRDAFFFPHYSFFFALQFCIAAFLYQVLSRDGGTPSLMIKEREEDWGGLDWGGLGEVRVGCCATAEDTFFFALQFFLRCSFFCIAVFFALQRFCVLLGVLELCQECVWRRLGWGDGPNLKATWTRGHKISLPCSFFCVAVFFALQFFLHCSFFCVAVFFALQFFLHCSFFCIAVFFALQFFLRCSFFALQFFLHRSFFCVAVFFALQFFLHCSFFCVADFSASPIQGTGNQCEPIVPEHARHAASMA